MPVAWTQGDPRKVIYPTDSRGQFCGQAGTPLEWVIISKTIGKRTSSWCHNQFFTGSKFFHDEKLQIHNVLPPPILFFLPYLYLILILLYILYICSCSLLPLLSLFKKKKNCAGWKRKKRKQCFCCSPWHMKNVCRVPSSTISFAVASSGIVSSPPSSPLLLLTCESFFSPSHSLSLSLVLAKPSF